MESKNHENVWALKILCAQTPEEKNDLIEGALNYYANKISAIVNATARVDTPFLCAAMQLISAATAQTLGESGQKAIKNLVDSSGTIAVDLTDIAEAEDE